MCMNVNTEQLREEIIRIMDEDGLSQSELAAQCGLSRTTLKSIMDASTQTTQRAVCRKIAAHTGREFIFKGDTVRFVKPDPTPTTLSNILITPTETARPTERRITEEEQRILHILRQAGIETGDDAERLLGLFRVTGEVDAALIQQTIALIKQIRGNDNH